MSPLHPILADLLLLALAALLLRSGARQLHYRDAPYLFRRRRLLWGALSLLFHGVALIGVMALLIELYSPVWWLAILIGSVPVLLIFVYALRVISNPRRMAMLNKRHWKGPELVP
ncbi:hypothetical protein FNU79_11490 [Deinococcus detaillensis]|uniref:DUF3325 domain-containing protein n=1 Tax=Deinococcus detaillensis TaxID=2592048 RepID=A0A553UUF3_9DEIO|nr:hypothetical protein [Deinococcus detaillensis]TSA83846.1 hypothetical protein FNU79_11490 [Deinococcus detaillensis]